MIYGSDGWYPYTEQLKGDPIDALFKNSTGCKRPHENAQIKFCRQIQGARNKATGIPVLAEQDRFPISLRDSRPSHCVAGTGFSFVLVFCLFFVGFSVCFLATIMRGTEATKESTPLTNSATERLR